MNYRAIFYYMGSIFKIIAVFLAIPLLTALCYREWETALAFVYSALVFVGAGFLCAPKAPKSRKIGTKEGLVIVGLSWILVSLIGALPFVFVGACNYFNAVFEAISGFTTTGATIFDDIEGLSHGILMWRSLTHWLGGMGILVFLLAVIPSSDGSTFQIMKFESPGPQVGKLVSKVRHSAAISYYIYLALTILEMLFLLCGGTSFFDSVNLSFSTAGTGGFAVLNDSVLSYNLYVKIVLIAFMLIFSINFNIYYLIAIGKISTALKNEELRVYVVYIAVCIVSVAVCIVSSVGSFGQALLDSAFTVSAIASTTGFTTVDFSEWSEAAKGILTVVTLLGACAGSTGGGFKFSRAIVIVKSGGATLMNAIRPNSVHLVKLNKKPLTRQETESITGYFVLFLLVILLSVILLCLFGNRFSVSFFTVITMFNNVGPNISEWGATSSYLAFDWASKLVMMADMLIGRLEIFPILLLFAPQTWSKRF